jgi:hypothetical protein
VGVVDVEDEGVGVEDEGEGVDVEDEDVGVEDEGDDWCEGEAVDLDED